MLLLEVLFFPLVAAIAVYYSGNKQAKYMAIGAAIIEFIASLRLLDVVVNSPNNSLNLITDWIAKPKISFALSADGLSIILVLLTTFLVPLILFSTYRK